MREVAPPVISTLRRGTLSAFASSATSASFAAPSCGAARTRAFSTARPSLIVSIPSMESRPPLGVSRTLMLTPPGAALKARTSENVGIDVIEDDALDEEDDQD